MRQIRKVVEKRVEVLWEDSVSREAWDCNILDGPARCVTIGYLVGETPKHIILAQSLGLETQQYGAQMCIPKCNIISKATWKRT